MPDGPFLIFTVEFWDGKIVTRTEEGPGPGTIEPEIMAEFFHQIADTITGAARPPEGD
jgi:hypothetical protein